MKSKNDEKIKKIDDKVKIIFKVNDFYSEILWLNL